MLTAFLYQTVNQICFIHINIAVFYQLVETLDSYWVLHLDTILQFDFLDAHIQK